MRRFTGLTVPLIVAAALPMPAVRAHPLRVFDACAAQREYGPPCSDTEHYLAGDWVYLRTYLKPRHSGKVVLVWRREPGSGRGWERVGSDRVNRNGISRWVWDTSRDDAKGDAAYRFRFSLPRHGTSDVVRVWVVADV